MVKDVLNDIDERIDSLPVIDCPFSHRWTFLLILAKGAVGNVRFTFDFPYFKIDEYIGDTHSFEFIRDCVTFNRYTKENKFGLIGLSNINPKDDTVIITEGVSDYLVTKMLYPEMNVLGNTTLTGNGMAKFINVNLFNKFIIVSDNDSGKEFNTGLNAANNLKAFFEGYGKEAIVHIMDDKDILNYVYQSYKLMHSN